MRLSVISHIERLHVDDIKMLKVYIVLDLCLEFILLYLMLINLIVVFDDFYSFNSSGFIDRLNQHTLITKSDFGCFETHLTHVIGAGWC